MDTSVPEFWNKRYAEGKTPWDLHGIPKALSDFLMKTPPSGRVLIPGCGSGYDIKAFALAGWDVLGIDFSPIAVKQAKNILEENEHRVIEADFFECKASGCNFIYERAFLCSLPPTLWQKYAATVSQLLDSGGKLIGIFLYGQEPEPPPFPLDESKASELFESSFRLTVNKPITDSLLVFQGRERWQEWTRL